MEKVTKDEVKKFEKLIEYAEEYIQKKAGRYLNFYSTYNFISSKYKADELSENDFNNKLISKLALHLQNYNRRTNIINYLNNKAAIDDIIFSNLTNENEMERKLCAIWKLDDVDKKDGKSIVEQYSKALSIIATSNNWKKLQYNDFQNIIKNINDNSEEFYTYLFQTRKQRRDNKYSNLTENTKKFIENLESINGISEVITCDILKECGCVNLIKPDVHINAIFKSYFDVKDGTEIDDNWEEDAKKKFKRENPKNGFNNRVINKFNKLFEGYKNKNKTHYYIDKILWICCTGNFYKDDITVNSMTRSDFFKFLQERYNNEQ